MIHLFSQKQEIPKVLIVGAGSKTAEAIQRVCSISAHPKKMYFITSGLSGYAKPDDVTTFQCDFTNRRALKDLCLRLQPDIIINTAAYTNVDKAEVERQLAWNINVTGVENLIAICRLLDAHLIHFSSDYVFDGENGPYREEDTPNPLGYYAKTKLASENACIGGNINYTIIRTNVLYGATTPIKPDFVTWVLNKCAEGKPFGVVDDQFSNPTLIDDVGYLVDKIINTRMQGLFHAGGADWDSRYNFAVKVLRMFKENISLVKPISSMDLQQVAERPKRAGLMNLKAEATFGIRFADTENGLMMMRRQLQISGSRSWFA